MDLVPGGVQRNLTAKRAAALLSEVTPTGAPAVTRCQLATELVDDIRQLEQRIAAVEARIKTAVAQSKTSLVQLFGVGPVLAATFLGEVGDIGRFPSKHHFAAHTGTAPLEASSGQVIRHRLSRAGDRKLNHALYMMAMVQVRRPTTGQAYYRRKLAEGKAPKEALRCLKRRLSDAVYRCLVVDRQRQLDLHDNGLAGARLAHSYAQPAAGSPAGWATAQQLTRGLRLPPRRGRCTQRPRRGT